MTGQVEKKDLMLPGKRREYALPDISRGAIAVKKHHRTACACGPIAEMLPCNCCVMDGFHQLLVVFQADVLLLEMVTQVYLLREKPSQSNMTVFPIVCQSKYTVKMCAMSTEERLMQDVIYIDKICMLALE
jgi:hypothetical protein